MTDHDDIEHRWLRAARPETAADDGWAASAAGERALQGVHAAVDEPAPRRRRRRWALALPTAMAAAAAAVLLVAGLGDGATSPPATHRGDPRPHVAGPVPAQMALAAFDDCGQMLAGLRAHTAKRVTAYGLEGSYRPIDFYPSADRVGYGAAASVSAPAAAGDPAHSTTNDQVADVDEPDVVKTDGTRIVTMTGGVLRVTDAATKKVTASLDLNLYDGASGAQLLVAGDRVLVILGSYGYGLRGPIAYYRGGFAEAGYVLVDIAKAPKVVATMQTKGAPVDARLVGSTVRFVVTSAPHFPFPMLRGTHTAVQRRDANRTVVQQAPLAAWLPTYTVTDPHGSQTRAVPCADVRHPAVYTGTTMTTIYTIDLADASNDLAPTTLAADGTTVYSTKTSLYLASSGVSGTTLLHRYDISSRAKPSYLGTGTVPGTLLSSYSMDDHAGHLRVVTTSVGKHGKTNSGLYELDDATLSTVAHLGGLGHDERVYAVRFLGDLGYVVTYRQVDPLYVLDLHDPAHPRTVGELKVSGYSSYLHPVGPGLLLGVGAQVDRYNEPNSVKLALLDVSTPTRPRQLSTVVQAHSWQFEVDPHAFLYWPAAHLAVVPTQSSTDGSTGVLAVRITGSKLHTLAVLHNPATLDADSGISRSLVVDGSLWTLSDEGLAVHDLSTLAQQEWIAFA